MKQNDKKSCKTRKITSGIMFILQVLLLLLLFHLFISLSHSRFLSSHIFFSYQYLKKKVWFYREKLLKEESLLLFFWSSSSSDIWSLSSSSSSSWLPMTQMSRELPFPLLLLSSCFLHCSQMRSNRWRREGTYSCQFLSVQFCRGGRMNTGIQAKDKRPNHLSVSCLYW